MKPRWGGGLTCGSFSGLDLQVKLRVCGVRADPRSVRHGVVWGLSRRLRGYQTVGSYDVDGRRIIPASVVLKAGRRCRFVSQPRRSLGVCPWPVFATDGAHPGRCRCALVLSLRMGQVGGQVVGEPAVAGPEGMGPGGPRARSGRRALCRARPCRGRRTGSGRSAPGGWL